MLLACAPVRLLHDACLCAPASTFHPASIAPPHAARVCAFLFSLRAACVCAFVLGVCCRPLLHAPDPLVQIRDAQPKHGQGVVRHAGLAWQGGAGRGLLHAAGEGECRYVHIHSPSRPVGVERTRLGVRPSRCRCCIRLLRVLSAPLRVPQLSAPLRVPQLSAPLRVPQLSAPLRVLLLSAPLRVPQLSAPLRVLLLSAPLLGALCTRTHSSGLAG